MCSQDINRYVLAGNFYLAVTSSGYINDRGLVLNAGVFEPGLNEVMSQHSYKQRLFDKATCSETRDQSLSRLTPGWCRLELLGCTWKFLIPTYKTES